MGFSGRNETNVKNETIFAAFCATKVNEIQHARVDRGVAYDIEENAYPDRYAGEMACRTQRRWHAPAQIIYHDQDPPDDRMNKFYSKVTSSDICQYDAVTDTAIKYLVALERVDAGAAQPL